MLAMNDAVLSNSSPTLCLFHTGDSWDHYLLFALSEINSGMYHSTLGNMTFQHKFLYADPRALTVEGEAQSVFSSNYESCNIFVGPAWTTQLAAIGEWAGLEHKPIVSGGATSPIFAQDNFGYVSRSIPSDLNVLKAFVGLIVEYGLDLINVVYVNDEYGQSVATALVDLSKGLFKIQLLQTFDGADDVEGINKALDDLEGSPTSVTFLGVTSLDIKEFLNIAGRRGMHDDHLWLSPTATQVAGELAGSTGGIWGISYGEELTEESTLAQRYLAKDTTPHIEAMEYGFQENYDTLTYWGTYAYDAVLAAAHGLAAATNRSDGEQVLKEIRGLSLNNTNTGVLQLDEHGDRIGARIPVFFITPEGTAEQFSVYYNGTVDFLQDPLWPGGSTTQPTDLIHTVDHDYNYLNRVVIYGYVLMSFALLSSVFFGAWTIYNRGGHIARASQPFFLVMICVGAFIFGSSILPMSVDDSSFSVRGCSIACMSIPWLLACGWTIIFSAIYAKLHRINTVMKHANSFRRIVVKEKDALPPFGIMFTINLTILLAWTLVDPLTWKRIETSETSSYGTCTIDSDKPDFIWKIFVSILGIVNGVALVMANWAAYKARYLSTELGESKWIAMAMGSLLQSLLFAIPILFLVRDNPATIYMVSSSIVFVITMSILGFIFVPKIMAHYKRKKERESTRNSRRHSAVCMPSESSVSNLDNGLKFNLLVSCVCSRNLLHCVPLIISLSLAHT